MYSIDSVADSLTNKLREYLEAQYPLTNKELQKKRNALLQKKNLLSTEPYIESTPVYQKGKTYKEMDIPNTLQILMQHLEKLEPSVGVFKYPYEHQVIALEEFLSQQKDLIVSTGTGSGKTESFLHPILNKLYLESKNKPHQFKNFRAVRALILYPMNALVNDQMSRLRLLFGNENVKDIFIESGGRPVQFGMYTSRTPYAGTQSYGRDRKNLDPLLNYYLEIEKNNPKLFEKMKSKGRIPAKDIKQFKLSKVKKTVDTYKTSPKDAELFTRHEMQNSSPDILVTNYSMLEYMLMRPIERSIWDDTKKWLAEDDDNEFILVLDEAHMYRGTGGAEVALLIRRLQQRLGIPRDRMRCILTSASLGKEDNIENAINFANKLTGKLNNRKYAYIKGITEKRGSKGELTEEDARLLAKINIDLFHNRINDYDSFYEANKEYFRQLGWGKLPTDIHKLPEYLYKNLDGYPPIESIIAMISGNAHTIKQIISEVCRFDNLNKEDRAQAVSNLIILANAAKLNNRVLLPARMHMFFRGVTGIFLCLNKHCENNNSNYGKMYDTSRLQCDCGMRTYEVLTHLFCGSAFIRVFVNNNSPFPKFTWNQKGRGILDEELTELHIYIEEVPPVALESGNIIPVWLDTKTGYLFDKPNENIALKDLFKGYIYLKPKNKIKSINNPVVSFDNCPSCGRDSRNNIRDLRTKGEPPFANLVREQFLIQNPSKDKVAQPNQGRKVLIFSDGRQKAARLAREIPRETEKDVLRQLILLIINNFKEIRLSDLSIYILLLLKIMDIDLLEGQDKDDLQKHIDDIYYNIKDEYGGNLSSFENIDKEEIQEIIEFLIRDGIAKNKLETAIETLFYQTIISPGYSLYDLTVGYLAPNKRGMQQMHRNLKDILEKHELYDLAVLFIKSMQDNIAIDPTLNDEQRCDIMTVYRSSWGVDKNYHFPAFKRILDQYNEVEREQISNNLFRLCLVNQGKYFLNPSLITVKNGLENKWYKCNQCRSWHPVVFHQQCPTCLSENIKKHPKNSEELKSEKGFWRDPIIKALKDIKIMNINVEEHSAQLSQKDVREALATTEKYELAFQDIKVDDQKTVDILSCTTTMEVGIDIGSLNAVAMRNIPPYRENYQQRAGRSGRRSTNLSTVITYAQDSPHDHYYFERPHKIISGNVRDVDIYIDNEKILKRHIHALLIQTFFHENLHSDESNLYFSLGRTIDFFEGDGKFNINHFDDWLTIQKGNKFKDFPTIFNIIPSEIVERKNKPRWKIFDELTSTMIDSLKNSYGEIKEELHNYISMIENEEEEDIPYYQNQDLLMFLFNLEFLPTYAFPRDLTSLYIQSDKMKNGEPYIEQRPQLELNRALSEYAPGRLVVIDKKMYRIEGIYDPFSKDTGDYIRELFALEKFIAYCPNCHFSQLQSNKESCPNCGTGLESKRYIKPTGFSPEAGRSLRRNEVREEFSYATTPQLPVPNREEDFNFNRINDNIQYAEAGNKQLIVLNRGSNLLGGFKMCKECGFITPDYQKAKANSHKKPFLTYGNNKCDGVLETVYLGNAFTSDILLIRMKLSEKIDFDPKSPSIHDALETIGEAFNIATSRILEIDIDEINVGYRLYKDKENQFFADLYIFDSLSGGAGYSYVAGKYVRDILNELFNVLHDCSGNCDKACYKCLKHYNNQFKHGILDRFLALDLITYILKGNFRVYNNIYKTQMLSVIQNMNNILGIESKLDKDKSELLLSDGTKIKVKNNIEKIPNKENILFFSPYEILNDLPNVHEKIKETLSITSVL